MQQSHKLFLDSSAFLAFIDRADYNHLKTTNIFDYLARGEFQLYTSNYVIIQSFARIEKELSPIIAQEFLLAILESNISIFYISESEFVAAYKLMRNTPSLKSGLMEVIHAQMMEKNGIHYIFTYNPWGNLLNTAITNLVLRQG